LNSTYAKLFSKTSIIYKKLSNKLCENEPFMEETEHGIQYKLTKRKKTGI